MKRKHFVKFLALSMMITTLTGSVPVFAAGEDETSLAANGGADIGYELNITDSFKLAIPKQITLQKNAYNDEDNFDAEYSIRMIGCDIAPTKQVKVSSSTSIDIERVGTDDTKSVTNDMNKDTKDTVDNNVIFTGQETGPYTGYMNGGSLVAGTWRADTEFTVSLEDKQTDDNTQTVTKAAGLYDADGNMLYALTAEQVETAHESSKGIRDISGVDKTQIAKVVIPEGVTSIRNGEFGYCRNLTSVTIPEGITSIGGCAFQSCTSLSSVTIPDSVTSIGSNAFVNCTSLSSAVIPEGVTSIGDYAFSGCSGLTSVTIPNSVTSIGDNVFSGCLGLTSVTIPNNVTSIGTSAFGKCSGLTSVIIPNSVTSIGNWAFNECSSLASVTIPDSVTSIGDWAFKNVPHIYYNGTATGTPWGALAIN